MAGDETNRHLNFDRAREPLTKSEAFDLFHEVRMAQMHIFVALKALKAGDNLAVEEAVSAMANHISELSTQVSTLVFDEEVPPRG